MYVLYIKLGIAVRVQRQITFGLSGCWVRNLNFPSLGEIVMVKVVF